MTEKVFTHKVDVNRKFELLNTWNTTELRKKEVQKFFNDYSVGKVTRRIGTNNSASLERNLCSLKPSIENLKSFDKKELSRFLEDLIKDKIKTKNNKPYSHRSKGEIINILKRFVKWKGLDPSPLDLIIGSKQKDPPTLSEEEINKLFDNCDTLRERFLISVLYSSGVRSEEFHNLRISDFEFPQNNSKDNNIKMRIRNEFTKTHGRTIPILWKKANQPIKEYLSLRIGEGVKPEEVVFPVTYRTIRKWLNSFGKRVLGKPINYHLFRHTRATHLNKVFDRSQMSVFFGWDFSSKMLDRYCNRQSIDFEVVEKRFDNTQIEELESKLEDVTNRLHQHNKVLLHFMNQEKNNKKYQGVIKSVLGKPIEILRK